MIELVAEGGFDTVTVRRLYHAAGVSSAAFYRHFDNAEDCFSSTYAQIMDCALRVARSASDDAADWESALRAALRGVLLAAAAEPKAAAAALIGPCTVGPGMLLREQEATRDFERLLAGLPDRAPCPTAASPSIGMGIVAAVMRVIQSRLLHGQAAQLPGCVEPVSDWASVLSDGFNVELETLAASLVANPGLRQRTSTAADAWLGSGEEEYSRLLAATVTLVKRQDYWQLTQAKIRAEAKVSRRAFASHFASVDECFLAAARALATEVITEVEQQAKRAPSWERGVCRAVLILCMEIARNPELAQIGFAQLLEPGLEGLYCRGAIIELSVERLRKEAPLGRRPSKIFTEASVAAGWQLIYQHVTAGRAPQVIELAPVIAYIVLAPVCGPRDALRVIRAEQEHLLGPLSGSSPLPTADGAP